MIRRPNAKENENDILNEQEKFLAGTVKSSVVVERKSPKEKPPLPENVMNETLEPNASNVLREVVERIIPDGSQALPLKFGPNKLPFPTAMKLPNQTKVCGKQSLFATHLLKTKLKRQAGKVQEESKVNLGVNSYIVDGSGLEGASAAQELHLENVKRLSQMSTEDIEQERQQLIESLSATHKGAELLAFLKGRRKMNEEIGAGVEISKGDITEKMDQTVLTDDTESYPIPLKEANKWLNMDKLEADKLAWTKPISSEKSNNEISNFARFDFNGILLPRNNDIPTHLGLHHHGEEPEAAGYTLEEIFQFIRSSVVQQRVLGLKILANVLMLAKNGAYDECLQLPILHHLIDSGVVLVVRWALDDNTSASVEAAVGALRALLVNDPDEVSLIRVFYWHDGMITPSLLPAGSRSDSEWKETLDAEAVKLDVMKGLLRTDLLTRLSYIFLNQNPSELTTCNIIEIFTRIARHSLESAISMANEVKLMNELVKRFLPQDGSLFILGGETQPMMLQTVKLVRVLCCSGCHVAHLLVNKYGVLESVYRYVATQLDSNDHTSFRNLTVEYYRLWQTLTKYGFGSEMNLDLLPLVMNRLLNFYQLDVTEYENEHFLLLIALICAIGSLVEVAAMPEKKAFIGDRKIEWQDLTGIISQLELCSQKWLWQFSHVEKFSEISHHLIGCVLNVLANVYQGFCNQTTDKIPVVTVLNRLEELWENSLSPFWESTTCREMLSRLRNFSYLLSKSKSGTVRDPPGLPSLGGAAWNGTTNPILTAGSPFHFCTALIRLVLSSLQLHRGLNPNLQSAILSDTTLVAYVREISNVETSGIHWFSRIECHFLVNLAKLASLKVSEPDIAIEFHRAACVAVNCLPIGDENLVLDALSTVFFNSEFFKEETLLPRALSELKLSDGGSVKLTRTKVIESLHSIRNTYIKVFCSVTGHRESYRDFVTLRHGPSRLMPVNWIYLPIGFCQEHFTKNDSNASIDTNLIIDCLKWMFLIESRPSAELFFYLGCVFLLGNDLFLDPIIRSYIAPHCIRLANARLEPKLTESQLPKNTPFNEFYFQLVTQFEAVSYGDSLFAFFVILPLQQIFDVKLRVKLWTENTYALRALTAPIERILIGVEKFLYPLETDQAMITAYYRGLVSGMITSISPLPYLIAVHHVHHFAFGSGTGELKFQAQLLANIRNSKNVVVSRHLINYEKPNLHSELGFDIIENDVN